MAKNEAVVEAVSGAAGSILALLATYPLKTIYTLQALSVDKKGTTTPVLSVLDIIKKYRLNGLYVGIQPSIVESGISTAVYFYLYSKLRELAVRSTRPTAQQQALDPQQQAPAPKASGSTKNQSIGIFASLLVAAVAGAGNQLVTLPLAVVITRMQAQQKRKMEAKAPASGLLSIIRDIWSESGLAGFWTGLLPALILVVNPAIQFMLYEQALRLLRRWKQERQQRQQQQQQHAPPAGGLDDAAGKQAAAAPQPPSLSAAEIFLASAAAKIGATVLTYPMIVVKSRLQASGKSQSSAQSQGPQYDGTLHVIKRTFLDEGAGGFFKGLKAKILQTALNAALMLMLKEQCYNITQAAVARSSAAAAAATAASGKATSLLT